MKRERIKIFKETSSSFIIAALFSEESLKTGDRIVAIDGAPTTSLCLEEANKMISSCADTAVFTIEYDVSVMGEMTFWFSL